MDGGTFVKVLREEVGIERGTHQNDLHVRPLQYQVFQYQQQEVTDQEKMK